jgi:hypothetical protein
MNELTPTEIAFINECNNLTRQIACVRKHEFNHANVHFFGRIGGTGGTINFLLNDKLHCGELEFRTREECLTILQQLVSRAHAQRR